MLLNKISLAVVSPSNNQIELFGIVSDKTNVGRISFNGNAWSTWSFLDLGDYKTVPSVVSTAPGSFDIFVTDTGNVLKTRHFDGSSWTPRIGWQNIAGGIAESGNAVAMALLWDRQTSRYDLETRSIDGSTTYIYNIESRPGRFAVIHDPPILKASAVTTITGVNLQEVVYVGSDDYMYHFHWIIEGFYWEQPVVIGQHKFISAPATATNALGELHVFGITPDQTVMQNTFRGGWTGWRQLGTRRFASAISAVVTQGGTQIELWGLGTDGALWHRSGDGNEWPVDWDSHGGNFISAPTLVSSTKGVYDVFAISNDGTVKHARRNETSSAWVPSYGS